MAHQDMAHHESDSPASGLGTNPSPSPDFYDDAASSNASPISTTTSLHMAPISDEGDDSGHGSTTEVMAPPPTELGRSSSAAGRGGCWTCRVRRKKCDEERVGESCRTCIRLGIECLGWGARRPEWLRDKERVAAYRAQIKDQLTREGRIRGQPRAVYMHAAHGHSPVAGPGPHTLRRNHSFGESELVHRSRYGPAHHSRLPYTPGRGSASARSSPTTPYYSAPGASPFVPFMDDTYIGHQFPHVASMSPTLPIPASELDVPYTPLASASDALASPDAQALSPAARLSPQRALSTLDDFVLYYFAHVRKAQFALAGNALTNTLYPIVMADPQGVVAHSICALACLHSTRVRIAQGLEQPVHDAAQSRPKYFYDQAAAHIASTKAQHGRHSDVEAVAAVQLIGFSVLASGWGEWERMVDVAGEWLIQNRLHEQENPKLALMNMPPAARFAAKATVWIDVFESITFLRPPRFLGLYRRLFGPSAGYWANAQFDLRMDSLTGCPDEAVLALAEIAALAHWKASEQRNGSLSTRELVRRGDAIEQQLRQLSIAPRQYTDVEDDPAGLRQASPLLGSEGVAAGSYAMEEIRRLAAEIFRETAVLYLHTVLSDSVPGVPEIVTAVTNIITLLHQLPPTEFDRALVFPLFLSGAMTDDPMLQSVVKERLALLDDGLGYILQPRSFLEQLWSQRSVGPGSSFAAPVEWREMLQAKKLLLL